MPIGWLLGLLFLAACSSEDEWLPEDGDEMAHVSLIIDTGAGILTKVGDDPNAKEGEFIHSLCILIVNQEGEIEQKLLPNLTDNEDAKKGDLSSWTSGTFDITVGEKRIYAFANWETVNSQEWNDIIGKRVGDTLAENDLNFSVDAASHIDIEKGKYIPMSGKAKAKMHATGGTQSYTVELVRLASRVEISFENRESYEISLSNMTIGNFADKVSLFRSETVTATNNIIKVLIAKNENEKLDQNQPKKGFSFYVNETTGDDSFIIDVTIAAQGKEKREIVTLNRNSLDRNSIYPISLVYSQYELHLKVTAQIAPIGVLPITVYDSGNQGLVNRFIIKLPEGCMFTMEASLYDNEGNKIELNSTPLMDIFTWKISGSGLVIDNPTIKDESYSGEKICGHLTAFTGSDAVLELNIVGFDNNDNTTLINLTYLIITPAVLLEDLTSTRAVAGKGSTWSMAERVPERVNLFISKEGGVK